MAKKLEKNVESKYALLEDQFVKETKSFFTDNKVKDIFNDISKGQNSYLRINRTETSVFDNEWIEMIEDCIPDLEDIVRNPKRNTKTVGDVVPVELARKTNSESVRHLATHTQFVKELKDNGDVIPSKILSISADDDYATYENRFIASLIRRLVLFVEKRYEFVVEHALLKDVDELKMKSKSVVDGSVVEMETKVKIVKPADYVGVEDKNSYVERIIELRNHLRYCYTSTFMKMVKTEREIRNPIVMTNIIRKNVKYHKCYLLWRYMEKYTLAGVSYSVNDKFAQFDNELLKEANMALVASFLAVRGSNPSRFASEKTKQYKPKILTSIDDEEFVYGPYLEGPIEFVRVDEPYRKASETTQTFYREEDVYGKPSNYIPKKEKIVGFMKKEEEDYIADARLENKSIHLLSNAKDQLLTRKRREAVAFEKKAISIIKSREQEKIALELRKAEEERLRQLMLAEEARRKLIGRALKDSEYNKFFKELEALNEAPIEEEVIEQEEQVEVNNDIDIADTLPLPEPLIEEIPEEVIPESPIVEEQKEETPVPEEAKPEEKKEDKPKKKRKKRRKTKKAKKTTKKVETPKAEESAPVEVKEEPTKEEVIPEPVKEPEPTAQVEVIKEEPAPEKKAKKAKAKKKSTPKKKVVKKSKPKAEEPKPVEEVKVEEPKPVEKPKPKKKVVKKSKPKPKAKVEQPKVEEPKKVETPKAEEPKPVKKATPKKRTTKKVETPKAEEPKPVKKAAPKKAKKVIKPKVEPKVEPIPVEEEWIDPRKYNFTLKQYAQKKSHKVKKRR